MKLNCSFSILTILFCLTISTITAYEGEDFQPALHTNKKLVTYLPKETCETINNSWGFNLKDASNKSRKELIQYLVKELAMGQIFY